MSTCSCHHTSVRFTSLNVTSWTRCLIDYIFLQIIFCKLLL